MVVKMFYSFSYISNRCNNFILEQRPFVDVGPATPGTCATAEMFTGYGRQHDIRDPRRARLCLHASLLCTQRHRVYEAGDFCILIKIKYNIFIAPYSQSAPWHCASRFLLSAVAQLVECRTRN